MEKITIENLSVDLRIGVTEKEREQRQTLSISVDMEPVRTYTDLNDSLDMTVDYSSVRREILGLLEGYEANLIESVARLIARHIKSSFAVESVTVRVKKYPYDDVDHVSYTLSI
jgi:dihydroneopterin aldolase